MIDINTHIVEMFTRMRGLWHVFFAIFLTGGLFVHIESTPYL